MRAFKTQQEGYYCDKCEEVFSEGDCESGHAWYLPEGADLCDDCGQYASEAIKENIWWCGNGCFHHDEGVAPEMVTLWQCGECDQRYTEREHAAECCN